MSIRVSQPAINLREKLTETGTPPIAAHGSELMNSSSVGESFDLVKAGRKNMLINGDMQIAQRGTSKANLTGSWEYSTVDRWLLALNGAGTWTASQDNDVPIGQGFTKSWKLNCTSADAAVDSGDYFLLEQKIEANRMAHLGWGTQGAKPATLSFWVKSGVTGDCNGMLYCPGFNTLRIVNQNFTIHNANEWEFKTMTFPAHGPENSFTINSVDAGARLWIWFKAGSQWTAGQGSRNYWRNNAHNQQAAGTTINIASSTSNNLWITGVQFEEGYNATPFEFKTYDEQLKDCQRYYMKRQLLGLCTTGFSQSGGGYNTHLMNVPLPCKMRAIPTVTFDNATQSACFQPGGDTANFQSFTNGLDFVSVSTGSTNSTWTTQVVSNGAPYVNLSAEL